MAPDEKILELLESLLARSRAGQVHWQRSVIRDQFFVRFPSSRLIIKYEIPTADPNYIEIAVEDTRENELWSVRIDQEDGHWMVAWDLFREAKRYATGLDSVLSEIEQAINRKGPVGNAS